jgi:hypothetical protein
MKSDEIRALMQVVGATHDIEMDCDAFLAQVALLVETRTRGQTVTGALRAAEDHERLCANCREECAALTAIVASEHGNA